MLHNRKSKHLLIAGLLGLSAMTQAAHRPEARDRSRTPERRAKAKPLQLSEAEISYFWDTMREIIATHGRTAAEIPTAIAELQALKQQVTASSCPPNIKLQREIELAIERLTKYGPRT